MKMDVDKKPCSCNTYGIAGNGQTNALREIAHEPTAGQCVKCGGESNRSANQGQRGMSFRDYI